MRDKETEEQQMSYQSKLMPFPDFQRLKSEIERCVQNYPCFTGTG